MPVILIAQPSKFEAPQNAEVNYVPGQILVSLQEGKTAYQVARSLDRVNGALTDFEVLKQVTPYMNIWLVGFNEQAVPMDAMLRAVKEHPLVEVAQVNHMVTHRAVPNDPLYSSQWQYNNDGSGGGVAGADIDAEAAWEITTGGLTPMGDEIVAAILDDGHNMNHPDFEDNLWVNTGEIPGNGIDDDGNGYVDDFLGWSIVTNSDNVSGGGHGTPVLGIVGAKGNNGIGVTGVNWDVKLMIIKNNFNTNEAAVLAAYSYALTMRQIYNETNGAEGAFVVATNASWGVDFGQPANAPLWCGFYDIMGQHGILSCGATINGNHNVDVVGDLPTACPSDFMISVTNLNNTDTKVTNAGFGAETIDLGAHGAGTFTTTAGTSPYGTFGGTSGATPHVTGAIALLYSAPCPSFIALAKADPEAAAMLARQYILEGVDPNESLQGITTTGGRLNLKNSLDLLMADCATSGCFAPFGLGTSLLSASETDVTYTLQWESFVESESFNLQYRPAGESEWTTVSNLLNNAFVLQGLDFCSEYQFRVQAVCTEDESEYSSIFVWTTDGCCDAPEQLTATEIGDDFINVAWTDVLAALSYDLRFRMLGDAVWTTLEGLTDNEASITGLQECSAYEIEVRTHCANNVLTEYSGAVTLGTDGCGTCTEANYCEAFSSNSSEEWIAEVQLNTLHNVSGSDDGYGDYTFMSTTLTAGGTYELSVTPGYADDEWDEYIMAWIDFNQNGIFEASEIVLDTDGVTTTTFTSEFTVPEDAQIGGTRMRITMRYEQMAGPCQQGFSWGEVEDYCVLIADPVTSVAQLDDPNVVVFPNPARDQFRVNLPEKYLNNAYTLHLVNAAGQLVSSQPVNTHEILWNTGNLSTGQYQLLMMGDDNILFRKPVILSK
ncbi:MAG: hypothetical protein EA392_06380 [Cryomorphaceae bacterium]|nr:MAG: hypothetical protein EA392_06380 [Cryomorphaceae bacterium]